MKNFLRIADGVDVTPVLHALAINPGLWDENTLRTAHAETAHAAVSDIWLMFNDPDGVVVNDIQVKPYPAWDVLKPLRALILELMHRVNGVQLGRCIVTRLPPGKTITPHVDGGAPATFYTRYQIALQSLPGALFNIEDETVCFRPGEIWLINNRAEHSVINNSADDRIVCIVDIRSA
jgi:hypothetical protein